jgi:ketosteroid isomerase-like protein
MPPTDLGRFGTGFEPEDKRMSDGDKIRHLLEQWAYRTRQDARDTILEHHADDAVIYDVLPPMKYEGASAYRESWDEWQPETTGDNMFDLYDLHVVAGGGIAFAYGFIHCGGTLADGNTFEDRVRATFCLENREGRWLITHQHISKPVSA